MSDSRGCGVSDRRLWEWVDEGRPDSDPIAGHLTTCDTCRERVVEMRCLEDGIARIVETAPAAPPAGIGPYRVVRRIAEGGMGVVYEARQESPERRVAIKVLKERAEGSAAEPMALAREARVLARLDHPEIASIFDAGSTEAGEPYLVMQFVDGRPIDRYAVDQALDPRARASLVARVSRAVHYAHQRGVLHCDLKPANVLVDRVGQPHVLDFGLSRPILDESGWSCSFTGGDLLGTLSYMSPEQARGEMDLVDVRTDVWGLGALLHELMTGRPPHPAENLPEAVDLLRRGVKRIDGIPRDLDHVVRKALEIEPDRRYDSAAALAEDLERFLSGAAVSARRATLGYRLRVLVRRNRVASAAVAAVILVLAVTVVLTRRAQSDAERERDDSLAAAGLLAEALRSSDPYEISLRGSMGGEALDRVAARLATGKMFAQDSLTAASLHATIGRIYRNRAWQEGGDEKLRAALRHTRAALVIRRKQLGGDHPDTIASLSDLAVLEDEEQGICADIVARFRAGQVPPCLGVARSMMTESRARADEHERETLVTEALTMLRQLGAGSVDVLEGLERHAQVAFERGDRALGARRFTEYKQARLLIGGEETPELARVTFIEGDRVRAGGPPAPRPTVASPDLWDERDVPVGGGGSRVHLIDGTVFAATAHEGEVNCGSGQWCVLDLRPREADPSPAPAPLDLDRNVYAGTYFAPPADADPWVENAHVFVWLPGLFDRERRIRPVLELRYAPEGCGWPPTGYSIVWSEPLYVERTDDENVRILTTRHPTDDAQDAAVAELQHWGATVGVYRIPFTLRVERVSNAPR